MTQPKVQLVAPLGNITVPGMNVTGVVTATIGDVGVAGSIIQGNNIDIGAGIITATSFVGDQIGTYRAASLTGSPDLVVGVVTSSGFVAQITGDVTGNLTGNVVGTAGSILSGNNLHVGIATATLVGDGSNLTGVGGSVFTHQTVTASGAATSIDLSAGSIITFNQSANTTVSFANTSEAMKVTLIRIKDTNDTARTISWPSSIKWNGGTAPTLISNTQSGDKQQFQLLTRDSGVTWYGWESYNFDKKGYQLWAWGYDNWGQRGLNDYGDNGSHRSSPTQVGTEELWEYITGDNYSFGLKIDGSLWTWGRGANGILGLNHNSDRSSPCQVGTDTTWATLMNANNYCMTSVKTDGSLWVWGRDQQGQLGQNQAGIYRSSPVRMGTGTDWNTTQGSTFFTSQGDGGVIHIKTNGELWCWGQNQNAQLPLNGQDGSGNPAPYGMSSPVRVPGTGWNGAAGKLGGGGNNNTFNIKTDGSLWAWGRADYGALGNGPNKQNQSSPIQIGTDTTWNYLMYGIGAGDYSDTMFAIKTNGTMWGWGRNDNGQLGFNNRTDYSSPRQVGTETTWSKVTQGNDYTMALKTDGTIWSWGNNNKGALGHNNANPVRYSSPVQIPGTQWHQVNAGGSGNSFALLNPNA